MSALESFLVSVVVEERQPVTKWGEVQHVPVAVVPHALDHRPWTPLGEGERGKLFLLGAAPVDLHRADTEQYRENLRSETPRLWIVLRPTSLVPPVDLHLVTADPTQAEVYVEAPGSIVEAVPMPDEIIDALAHFVERHHVERVFLKRKRDRAGEGRR